MPEDKTKELEDLKELNNSFTNWFYNERLFALDSNPF